MNMHVTLHLRGENLPNKDFWGLGRSDPYYEVYFEKAKYYESEVIRSNSNPEWAPAEFSLPKSAMNKNVTIKVMDRDRIWDDQIHKFEIRYPFEKKTHVVGKFRLLNKGKNTTTLMQFSVLNYDSQG